MKVAGSDSEGRNKVRMAMEKEKGGWQWRRRREDGRDCGGVSTPGHGQGEGPARYEFRG